MCMRHRRQRLPRRGHDGERALEKGAGEEEMRLGRLARPRWWPRPAPALTGGGRGQRPARLRGSVRERGRDCSAVGSAMGRAEGRAARGGGGAAGPSLAPTKKGAEPDCRSCDGRLEAPLDSAMAPALRRGRQGRRGKRKGEGESEWREGRASARYTCTRARGGKRAQLREATRPAASEVGRPRELQRQTSHCSTFSKF